MVFVLPFEIFMCTVMSEKKKRFLFLKGIVRLRASNKV